MMNIWVLIIVVSTYDGNSTTTQEFFSKESCLAAKQLVEANLQPYRGGETNGECIQK